MSKILKAHFTIIALILLVPSVAYAHGVQILFYLAPDVFWIIFLIFVLLFWEESLINKIILTSSISLGAVLAWFLPFDYFDYLDHMLRYIAKKFGLPLGIGTIAYLAIGIGKRRNHKNATRTD